MTPEQDLLTRDFFEKVALDKTLFPDTPATQRSLCGTILTLLNYDVIGNAYVEKGSVTQVPFGQLPEFESEWDADRAAAEEKINASGSDSTNVSESSQPTEDSEVREAVLREDV